MQTEINPIVLSRLKKCRDLPSPPGVAEQIILLSSKIDSDMDTLAELVSMDPALSAKILRMANSSLYMRRVKAENIQQAVIMFGWTGTLNIALSFSLVADMKSNAKQNGLNYELFWQRSLAAGVAGKKLGEALRYMAKEELFLPCLLQDIGMLALDKAMPEIYKNIGDGQQNHASVLELELEKTGSDHAAIGAWLLNRWDIPEKITELISLSHSAQAPEVEIEGNELPAKCVAFSGVIADCICSEESNRDYMNAASRAESEFNLDITDFLSLLGSATEEYQEMATLFDVDVGDSGALQDTADHAKEVLAKQAYGMM